VKLQFGAYIVDDESRQLIRDGVPVRLSTRAFDLLALLIRERPRALKKEDLHSTLWPDTFVSDASLAMLVAEVRSALGETARQPRCLRTLHRHGYAFQADARELTLATIGFWLVTESRQIPLSTGANIVGRDPRVGIWLDSPSVSRQHACIRVESGNATVEDLGSKNGTRARDELVTQVTPLRDGDDLRFGSVNASFHVWSVEPTRTEAGSA
jgi:DNA-binding winged helix-turn-helix (wHTH) protein